MEGVDGDGGGGDCTRTFFVIFLGIAVCSMLAASAAMFPY